MVNLRSLSARQWLAIVATAVLAVVASVVLFTALSRLLNTPTPDTAPPDAAAPAAAPDAPAAVPKIKATLYFASEDGMRLVPTEQEVPLAATIPQGAKLRGIFISERNEAFVDLDASIRTAHPGGALQELMTVYTIVNALVTNLPNLQEVQILIDGREADTLAGHVDLRRPLRKNEGLILSSVTPTPPPTQ